MNSHELININEKTINMLNIMQNGLIRYISKLLNIKQLICKYKINFVRQLDKHTLCKQIYTKIWERLPNSPLKNKNFYTLRFVSSSRF